MITCAACGGEVPDQFRFCGWCGESLTAAEPAGPSHETRRSVTVVFSDLKGSTALGERLDSEALREVMTRYFSEMSAVLERHGGTVEKFIGDAIMAVFGMPVAHEDDALRAVRAALEMKERLAGLNVELDRRWGVTLANRTGVNTGPVIASGDSASRQRLVTGDTVNVAARLEQAAPEYEVLIGDSTYRLVRDAVEVEEVEPLELKGKSERVPAYRLLAVSKIGAGGRRHDLPLIGREEELETLGRAFADTVDEHTSRLVVVHADAGTGKSRLIEELATIVAERDGRALVGRCLPYGRGITFWPLVEMVAQVAGIDEHDTPEVARRKIAALVDDEAAVERIAVAVGLSEERFPLDELFWGVRKLFQSLGSDGPVVALFEDVHWAETALLELVAHLATVTSGTPLLVLCTARPELADRHPGWPEVEGAVDVRLGPLAPDAVDRLVEHLLGGALPREVRARIGTAAAGNPLFVEQLVTMFVDEGALRREGDRWVASSGFADRVAVPASIDALLAARLDLLPEDELVVTESASVIGQVFATEAVEELVPAPAGEVPARLERVESRRLIQSTDEAESFRFHHILIRDSAYNRLPKRSRARLHGLFAGWAERVNRERGRELEFQEIVGYHLEQARRYLLELAPLDDEGVELGRRAAAHLGPAGLRAFSRGDMWAASGLLRRTVELLPEGSPERIELIPDLGEALMQIGEFDQAQRLLDDAIESARALGDVPLQAKTVLTRLLVEQPTTEDLDALRAEVQAETDRWIPLLEMHEDAAGLAKAWRMVAFIHGSVCRWKETADAEEHAIRYARLAGDARQVERLLGSYVMALTEGPTPASEAIDRTDEVLSLGLNDRQAKALALLQLAPLYAMGRDFDRARELVDAATDLLRELGATVLAARTSDSSARVELMAGDLETAEAKLRADYDALTAMDERYYRPNITALLAKTLYDGGKHDEAERFVDIAAELTSPDDVEALALLRSVQARLLASRGLTEEARDLALEVARQTRETDAPVFRADTLTDLAEALESSPEDQVAALQEARTLYAQKQHLVGVARAESELDRIAGQAERTA